MKSLIGKLRSAAQSTQMTLGTWVLSFAGIVLIRIFLEQFSSFRPGRFPAIDLPTLVHYNIFFLTSLLALMVILVFFAKISLREVAAISIFGLLIIWSAPIIDLLTGGVGGHIMTYIFAEGQELWIRFVTFFSKYGHMNSGVTLGMQIEIIAIIIFCIIYVFTVTKSLFRAFGAGLAFYTFLFLYGSAPSLIALLLPGQNGAWDSILQSMISSNILPGHIHPSFSATNTALLDLAFNKIMLGVGILTAMFTTGLLFFLGAREKFIAVVKNCRPERMLLLFLLFLLGVVLSYTRWFTSWIDVQSFILAVAALVCAVMFSICQNDIEDEDIDAVSNQARPLISKELSRSDMRTASEIFLVFSLLSAYASSHYVLFFIFLFLFTYFIYSNPPLRLKRVPILSSFLISFAFLSVIMSGFFLVSLDKNITAFPFSFAVAILVFFTIIANIRDIKDFEGDRAAGIKTLPVLLGLRRSQKIIAGATCFLFLLIPLYLRLPSLIIPAILASVFSWHFITSKNYKEWKGFAVYLLYFAVIIAAMFLK